ncbi:hypothetical protein MWN34_03980 [Ancylobacter sp. 6x-1]|uniref:Glycosyltransferase family 2 protein n=1 Tax=Ancylobacter crimeensis TaxID=2579147 RepID=A0ABT0D7Y2_9HYPH|nr:hypothetical protein [Ancylobacter crimeensis]MCK0196066.1 hypothetical protein [Ancylobacter crimeensis]
MSKVPIDMATADAGERDGDGLRVFVPFVNEEMATRFFTRNERWHGYQVELIDNRVRKAGLSTLYNEIIRRHLDEDAWLFFVHEDFEVQGPVFKTAGLRREAIYGTFGVKMQGHLPIGHGEHCCSRKDGTGGIQVGLPISAPVWVDTLDCQSILLHTSVLRNHPGLRFDEELTFDLYAEALSMSAQESCGLPVFVLPLAFQHYSHGKVTERYWRGLRHLARRFPDMALPGACSFLGGRAAELEAHFTYDIIANPASERSA